MLTLCFPDAARLSPLLPEVHQHLPTARGEAELPPEPKKVCKIQKRTRESKAKRYSYIQDCKVVPREVCDQVKSVVLVLECSLILPSAGGAAAVHLRAGEELPDPRVNK